MNCLHVSLRRMLLKFKYIYLLAAVALTVDVSLTVGVPANEHSTTLAGTLKGAANPGSPSRTLYAVNQSATTRGSISVYDINHEHTLLKTIPTVPNVDDVKGVAVSAATGKLYVAYRTRSGAGMIYCLNIYEDAVL